MRTLATGIRNAAVASCLALVLLATDAHALFIVNLPWVVPAKLGQSTRLYMNLTSSDGATLVAVRTDAADSTAIRGPRKGAPAMSALPLPAGTLVALAPGKSYIDLVKLTRTVKAGDRVDVTLTFEGADGVRTDIPLRVEVRVRSALDDEMRAHHH